MLATVIFHLDPQSASRPLNRLHLMNKVRSFVARMSPLQHYPPYDHSQRHQRRVSSSGAPPDAKRNIAWGTILRYGYQAAHKTILTLPPYASALVVEFIRADSNSSAPEACVWHLDRDYMEELMVQFHRWDGFLSEEIVQPYNSCLCMRWMYLCDRFPWKMVRWNGSIWFNEALEKLYYWRVRKINGSRVYDF